MTAALSTVELRHNVQQATQPAEKSDSSLRMTIDQQLTFDCFARTVTPRALVMMESASGQHDVARDLVQDALIALVTRYAHKPNNEWTPLFYTILNNKLMDWRRRETRRNRLFAWIKPASHDDDLELDPLDLVEDPQAINPADHFQRAGDMQAVQAAIKLLPLRQQQAFMLRAWEGLDIRQCAAVMGCSEGSVKTHYHRAQQALRLRLSELTDPHD